MKVSFWLAVLAGLLLGVVRGVDLAFFIDPATGFCTVGSVWLRYGALAAASVLSVAAGRLCPSRPQALCAKRPLAGWLALLTAVFFAGAGLLQLVGSFYQMSAIVRGLLELACAVWLWCLSRAWLRRGSWRAPANSLVPAVLGSAVFYWNVLARFMENSSSWHRVEETAMVWQYLAALVFLTALARALCLPDTADGKALCASGLCTFALCFCWQLPQAAVEIAQWKEAAPFSVATTYFDTALCGVGLLGGVCAALAVRGEGQAAREIG